MISSVQQNTPPIIGSPLPKNEISPSPNVTGSPYTSPNTKPRVYFSFGEQIAYVNPFCLATIRKVAIIFSSLLGSAAGIGALARGLAGALIGASFTASFLLVASVCYTVYMHINRKKFQHSLPCQSTPQIGSPQLGKYYSSNLRLAKTADEGFQWKKALIGAAKQSIELSANFAGGPEFQEILTLIGSRLAKQPTLRAHILINPELLEEKNKTLLQRLQALYPTRFSYVIHGPRLLLLPVPHSEENHVKVLIVDNKYFVTGGTSIHPQLSREDTSGRLDIRSLQSIGSKSLDTATRDNDIVGEGEQTASVMRNEFFRLFQLCEQQVTNADKVNRFFPVSDQKGICTTFHEKDGLFEHARLKVIVGGAEHGDRNPIVAEYIKRIEKAKKHICFANMQFNPDPRIIDALKKRRSHKEPPTVCLISNGTKGRSCFGRLLTVSTSRKNYHHVDKPYEFQTPGTQFHKKMSMFDGRYTLIGSFNLGMKSSRYDFEMICAIKDERVSAAAQEVLEEDISHSKLRTQMTKGIRRLWSNFISTMLSFTTNFV